MYLIYILTYSANYCNWYNLPAKVANQTDPRYWTYDIGCSTDVCLHWKYTNWLKVFEFFKAHPRAKATFATKHVNMKLLEFNPQQKIRIRFSSMPASISDILESKTSRIIDRIKAVNLFIQAGYEVHLNFSPIVAFEGWLDEYTKLLQDIDQHIQEEYKLFVKAECIFLTHNKGRHERNLLSSRVESEELIWKPEIQEDKVSNTAVVL